MLTNLTPLRLMSRAQAVCSSRALSLSAALVCGSWLSACGTHDLRPGESSKLFQSSSVASELAAVSGLWAKQTVLSSEATALGMTSRSKIERVMLARVVVDGQQMTSQEELCDIRAITGSNNSMVFPDALKRVIPLRLQNFALVQDADQTLLQAEPVVEVFGAKLTDNALESLPTRANDGRVFDQDLDGQPGITVQVAVKAGIFKIKGSVYMLERTRSQEQGQLVATDTIKGKIDWGTEQRTLGSDSTVLAGVTPTLKSRLDESEFTMRKVSESATCESVLADYTNLFNKPTL